jgi:hypothetical protein
VLTVHGTNFVTGATVKWGSTVLTVESVTTTELTAAVPASLIAKAGKASVTVTTAGGTSAAATFTVTTPQTISFPNPGPVSYGVAPLTLKAVASSGLAVSYKVTSGPATVSGSTLKITGAGAVVVEAMQSGNASYAAATPVSVSIMVNKAVLTVTAKSASRVYGAANPALTYTITGYKNGDPSKVVTGTASLTTTAIATSAVGAYPISFATETLTAANYSFTYVKGSLTVTIALSPSSATAGAAGFTLTINGTNFAAGSVVKWGTTALATTYVSASKLTAAVPKSLIATAGTASVTVTTAGSTLAAATFTIQ